MQTPPQTSDSHVPYASYSPAEPEGWHSVRWIISGWALAIMLRHLFYFGGVSSIRLGSSNLFTAVGAGIEVAALLVVFIGSIQSQGRTIAFVGSILFLIAAALSWGIAELMLVGRSQSGTEIVFRTGWQLFASVGSVAPAVIAMILSSGRKNR